MYFDLLDIPQEFIEPAVKPYTLSIQLKGDCGRNGYPNVSITLNKKVLYDGSVNELLLNFDIVPDTKRQLLLIEMYNKIDDDTVVENGTIVKDKFVTVQSITVDGVQLDHFKYFRYRPKYSQGFLEIVKDAPKLVTTDTLNFNGKFAVYFESPVLQYLAKRQFMNGVYYTTKAKLTADSFSKLAGLYTKLK